MPFKTIRDLGDEITPDYFVAIDEANRMTIVDQEGDAVFFVPPSLLELEQSMADPILVEMAHIVTMTRHQSWARGSVHGSQEVRNDLQRLLGIDRLTAALERIADQDLKI